MLKTMRQKRYEALKAEGFRAKEAIVLSRFPFKRHGGRINKAMLSLRRERAILKSNSTRENFYDRIRESHRQRDWLETTAKGDLNYMLNLLKRQQLEEDSPSAKYAKRKDFSKGNVKAQKARRRERQRTSDRYEVYGEGGKVIGHSRFNYSTKRFESA